MQQLVIVNKKNGHVYFRPNAIPNGNKILLCATILGGATIVHKGDVYVSLNWALSYFRKYQDSEFISALIHLKNNVDDQSAEVGIKVCDE